ncbi:MAG: prepilin peptidase, partial [Methylococcales bacterium]
MALIQLLETDPYARIILAGILGLMIGSFLNVVIHRLPIMMERAWRCDSIDYLGLAPEAAPEARIYNLFQPGSQCPDCRIAIRSWHNIPIVSYVLLRGRCAHCKMPISMRYPAVEALTALLSVVVVWHFGFTIQAGAALILTWALIALSLIDIGHRLLPDAITLPVLWLGLVLSIGNVFTDSHSAIIGAICGYLILWIVYQLFRIATGKQGMGFGDFKLSAMLGAWLGWQYVPVVVLLSSLAGALIGTLMIVFGNRDRAEPIPFGPYLSVSGWIVV